MTWFHFCLGRISQKWKQALNAYCNTSIKTVDEDHWASLLISHMWQYIIRLWKYINSAVHGANAQESTNIALRKLHQEMQNQFDNYDLNPSYFLQPLSYLFTSKSFDHLKSTSYDNQQCWLRSVKEALSILNLQYAHLRRISEQVMSLFYIIQPGDHWGSTDSTYQPTSTDNLSITTKDTYTPTSLKDSPASDSYISLSTTTSTDQLSYFSHDDSFERTSSSSQPPTEISLSTHSSV